jgi:uncharacterized membrane protein SpoIIM required for sporulation/ABC-type transport system involved in multi-copper enzyme maturation permease subunit
VVTRREIKDTLRDWRIIMPIVILVTIFPFLANLAANRGVDFVNKYGADIIVERLFPFLMLVVGFFPSSFSLVIALETFVGEKERRSMESILATPLTDLQLYIGKLLAATFPPVMASYLGMGVYVLLLGFSLHWWPEPSLLLVSLVLSTAEALVMVSGAVIVSSQATSVRAANLLASFIIIPMAALLQAEAGLLLFAHYTTLWLIALFLIVLNVMLIRLGVQVFDREHLLGKDIDRLDIKGIGRTFWRAAWPGQGLKRLYGREIPDILRGLRSELWLTLLVVFVGGSLVGWWGSHNFALPEDMLTDFEITTMTQGQFREAVEQSGLLPTFSTWAIWWNNIRALGIAALLALFTIGIGALLLLMAPIAIVAYMTLQVVRLSINPWLFLTVFILPHGIIELPAAVIATAQAVRIGDILLSPPEQGGGVMGVAREAGRFVKLFVALIIPLLLLAAWVEAEVTMPLALNTFFR